MSLAVALQYWEQLDCPLSLGFWLCAKYQDWASIMAYRPDVNRHLDYDSKSLARDLATVSFLKKFPFIPNGPSMKAKRAKALETWFAGEASCFRTNRRLESYLVSPYSGDPIGRFLSRVRSRLLRWLGPPPNEGELQAAMRHGPGTTFSSSVPNPTAADKFSDVMTFTRDAIPHTWDVIPTLWGRSLVESGRDRWYEIVRGNRHTVVPKDSQTLRSIGIEPSLNVYVQLGLGALLRKRLKDRAGWDLSVAQSIHRKMACSASLTGSFSTLDLKNASDTLAWYLVKVLLHDSGWLPLLEGVRSTHTRVDNRWHLLEKFSSMGNGYTFELETCIFAALCSVALEESGEIGVLGHDLFVYGDDIIVPTQSTRAVTAALSWCGFTINSEKSFSAGSFRESCGGDYLLGKPVRGYYLKEKTYYGTEQVYAIHNGVLDCLKNSGVDSPWFMDWLRTHLLPDRLRSIGGPTRLGNSVLHGVPYGRFRKKYGITWIRTVRWSVPIIVPWTYFSETVRLACRLTGAGESIGILSRGSRLATGFSWASDS